MIAAIFISYMALLNSVISSPEPLFPIDGAAGGPMPMNGVWALEKADCDTPTSIDLSTWPKCATPLGFVDGEVAALERPGPGKKATADQFYSIARTHFQVVLAPSGAAAPSATPATSPSGGASMTVPPVAPAIVQIDIPLFLSHTFVYLALQPTDADPATGRFTRSSAWAIACPKVAASGVANDGQRCSASSAEGVRAAAALAAADPTAAYRLFRVEAAADSASPPAFATPGPAATPQPPAASPPTASPPSR